NVETIGQPVTRPTMRFPRRQTNSDEPAAQARVALAGAAGSIVQQALIAVACLAFLTTPNVHAQPPKKVDFAHDIVPIIKARCARCHTNGKYKASLSLDTREDILKAKVVVPGKSGKSVLFERVSSKDSDFRMPSKSKPLPAEDIELIRRWIDE